MNNSESTAKVNEPTLFSILGDMERSIGRMDDLVLEVNRLRDGFNMEAPTEPIKDMSKVQLSEGEINPNSVTVMNGEGFVQSFDRLNRVLLERIDEIGSKVEYVRRNIG